VSGPFTRDSMGVRHACPPGIACRPDGYGLYGSAHFECGCRPAIHRFKCEGCGDVVGWCVGGEDGLCEECWAVENPEVDAA
jgi:hypothetical protein